MLYAIFQTSLVIYGGQFPQLEEQVVSGSEPATFRQQLTTDNYLSWDSNPSGEERVVSKRDALTTRPQRALIQIEFTKFCRSIGPRYIL